MQIRSKTKVWSKKLVLSLLKSLSLCICNFFDVLTLIFFQNRKHNTQACICFYFIYLQLKHQYDLKLWVTVIIACCMFTGENSMEIKTESNSDDVTECPQDDKPNTGMFCFCILCINLSIYHVHDVFCTLNLIVLFHWPHTSSSQGWPPATWLHSLSDAEYQSAEESFPYGRLGCTLMVMIFPVIEVAIFYSI